VGREKVTQRAEDKGRFLVPSLRNISRTAPYMHDGRFDTLEEVLAHYQHGIQPCDTLSAELKEPLPRLTANDQAALLAFLQTLTDEPFVRQ
jgi:cytochrome c peroxidase